MRVESLYISNFRNLSTQEIFPGQLLNEFVGENAQGKTALLESIHTLILGGSFRTFQFKEVVAHGKSEACIQAVLEADGVHTTISFHYNMKERTIFINGSKQLSSSAFLGTMLGVTCSLQDNDLIYGSPQLRRRYLDQQIAQIDPFYVDQLRRYSRALLQRNRLLKTKDLRTIRAFEEQLAKAATYIITQRRSTVACLQNLVEPFYQELFGTVLSNQLSLRYQTQCTSEDICAWHMEQYDKRRDSEAKIMTTLIGPHRDDLILLLADHASKVVGSFGQIRAISFALRLAEWSLLKNRSSQKPLFLIDDMASSLDTVRVEKLLKICEGFGQIFISNCLAVSSKSTKFIVRNGLATHVQEGFLLVP